MVEVVYVCMFVLILQVAWAEPHAAPGMGPRGFCPGEGASLGAW